MRETEPVTGQTQGATLVWGLRIWTGVGFMSLQFSRAVFLAAMLLGSVPMLAPPPAFAESATSEGAKALAQSLAPYFGQSAFDHGLITIAPKGEAYELNFDLQGIVDGFGLPLPKDAVRIGRYSLLVAPLPDGSWKVTSDNFPKVDIKGPTPQGDMAASLSASGSVFEGVFDPKFAAFLSFTQKIPTFDVKARAPNSDVAATATDVEAQLQGKGLADGSVSGKFQETFRHVVETVKMTPAAKPNGPPSSPVNVSYDIGPITYDGAFENLRTKEFRDLFAFLIAHHDQELVALQDELKDKILATFPLWKNIDATVKVENLALDTALGRFGAKSVVQSLHQTGLVAQAAMELGVQHGRAERASRPRSGLGGSARADGPRHRCQISDERPRQDRPRCHYQLGSSAQSVSGCVQACDHRDDGDGQRAQAHSCARSYIFAEP